MIGFVRRTSAAGAIVLLALPPAGAQEQGLTPEQVAVIEKEVTAALHNYYRLYTEKNNKALSSEVFLDQWIQLGANGPQLTNTEPADVARRFAANIERLEAQGWVKSEYPKPIVCVINAGTAIASGEFMRYRKDGSVISTNGTSYLFGKTPAGWRIVSFFGHEVGKIIGCEDGK
jgi:NTF2-like protein (DUF6841)